LRELIKFDNLFLMKTYIVEILTNGESLNQPFEFSGFSARTCLEAAMKFAEKYVKQGKTVRVSCGGELVWEGNFIG